MDDYDPVPMAAALAVAHLLKGEEEKARERLAEIPRHRRGDVKIALDNLDMMLSRLGRG